MATYEECIKYDFVALLSNKYFQFFQVLSVRQTHCKFQILWETNFLTEILKMEHLLLIMRKKTETTLNISYSEKIMSH